MIKSGRNGKTRRISSRLLRLPESVTDISNKPTSYLPIQKVNKYFSVQVSSILIHYGSLLLLN